MCNLKLKLFIYFDCQTDWVLDSNTMMEIKIAVRLLVERVEDQNYDVLEFGIVGLYRKKI